MEFKIMVTRNGDVVSTKRETFIDLDDAISECLSHFDRKVETVDISRHWSGGSTIGATLSVYFKYWGTRVEIIDVTAFELEFGYPI